MNPNTPYNSGGLHNMVEKVRTYCSKILPLVFDNTLSYYESICAFSAKVNELCDAVNAQNLTICEFTHMVEIELDKFEKYIQEKYNELRDDVNDLDTRTGALETTVAVYNTRIGTLETTVADMHEQLTSMLEDINVMSGDISNLEGSVHDLEVEVGQKVDYTDVINQVLENSDKIPTSGAVYDAIAQGGGGGTFVPDATTTSKGIVQIGDNINVNTGVISVPNATTGSKGAMQVGSNLNVSDGVVSVPDATLLSKGAVTVGSGLTIDQHTPGVITLVQATENVIGGVKVGDSLTMGNNGKLNVDQATTSAYGTVKIGDNLETDSNGALKVKDAEAGTIKGAVTIDNMTSNLTLSNGVLDVPTGTKNNKGVLQVGNNLSVNGGVVDVPEASTVAKGIMTIDGTNPQANPLKLTSGVLSLDIGDRLEVVSGELNAKKATVSQLGVVAPALGGAISVDSSGAIDVDQATTLKKGAVTLGSTFGTQQTGTVPTCADVYNNFATKSTENFAVRADAPNLDGDSQLYKIDAQGVRTNLTPVVQGGGSPTVPDATTSSKGIVQIGDNIEVANGVISVPEANANTSGVIKVDSSTPLYMNTQTNTINIKDGSTTAKGAVQVGNNIDVNSGVISVPTANGSTSYGVVKLGNNSNLSMGNDGIIDVYTGTKNNKGVLQVGDNIDVSAGTISVPDATDTTKGVITYDTRHLEKTSSGKLNVITTSSVTGGTSFDIPTSSAIIQYNNSLMTSSVASGDTTHVPTSDAVYQAVQGVGGRYLIPTPQESWTNSADCFFSSSQSGSIYDAHIADSASLIIGTKSFNVTTNSYSLLWIKGSLLDNYTSADEALSNLDINTTSKGAATGVIGSATLVTLISSNIEYLVLSLTNPQYLLFTIKK